MKRAMFFDKIDNKSVRCDLCPHKCTIKNERSGKCNVRTNKNGELCSDVYGKISALNIDPVEKKPLYHYHPGKSILSIGSIGCNFKCKFCQNWEISQPNRDNLRELKDFSPKSIVDFAQKNLSFGLAYTYNEPTVWYEMMYDTARLSHENGLKNVMVSNGFINPKPLEELLKYIDAFNIDLKSFSNEFYKKLISADIEPVKYSLEQIKKSGRHLEVTNLVIPGMNDDPGDFFKMVKWISDTLGKNTVMHISRYHPSYKMDIESTPASTLNKLFMIAKGELNHVYLGNINTGIGNNTNCSNCGNVIITRAGYYTEKTGIDDSGHCLNCGFIDIIYN